MRDKHNDKRDFKQIKVAGEYGLDEPKQEYPEGKDDELSAGNGPKKQPDPDKHLGAEEGDMEEPAIVADTDEVK